MPAPSAAQAQYDTQARIVEDAVRAASLLWSELDAQAMSASWQSQRVGDRLFLTVAQAQLLAASSADFYAALLLAQQNVTAPAAGSVVPTSLAGIASDGRDLASLLVEPLVTSAVARAAGATPTEAKSSGLSSLVRIVDTQVADAGRAAQSIATTTRISGFIRAIHAGACGRCVILAGRWYRYDAGFDRHPMCHCYGIPAPEDVAGDAATDPMVYFHSLTAEEQNKAFTKAGAQAVRDGADVSQVVNARRGALGLSSPGRLTAAEQRTLRNGRKKGEARLQRVDVYGRQVAITTEGTTKRGLAGQRLIESGRANVPRLMPEAVYEIAHDRADAIRLLRLYGYIR